MLFVISNRAVIIIVHEVHYGSVLIGLFEFIYWHNYMCNCLGEFMEIAYDTSISCFMLRGVLGSSIGLSYKG